MTIRGIIVAVTALVSCQTLAQAPPSTPFVPNGIEQLREALKTGQQGQLIEVPAQLAKDWLQTGDSAAWTAIQQQRPTAIDLNSLLEQQELPTERLTDGIDPFAIYSENGDLSKLWFRGAGVNPSTFAEAVINAVRSGKQSTTVLTAKDGDKSASSKPQELLTAAQDAASAICDMPVKPEQVSVSVSGGFSFIIEGGATVEATFKTVALCRWWDLNEP